MAKKDLSGDRRDGRGARGRPGKHVSRPRLTDEQKLTLLCMLIRNQHVFDQAADRLTVEHLMNALPDSAAYALIWRVVTEFYVEYGCLPAREVIELRIQAMLTEAPEVLNDEEIVDAEQFLAEAFEPNALDPFATSTVRWAEGCLRSLLSESLADRAAALIRSSDDAVASDLPALLDSLSQEAHSVATIGLTGLGGPLFGSGWEDEEMAASRPSGVDIIDAFTNGEVPGEVVLIAGPYGSCKSLLAVHSCICAARLHRRQWQTHLAARKADKSLPAGRRPMAVYVSYEMPKKEFRRRLLANAANIPYNRLMKVSKLAELRGPGSDLLKYERRLFAAKLATGREVPSELERVQEAARLIDEHIMFVDMTGKDNGLEHYGQEGVPELARALTALFPETGSRWPAVLWIDHTAELADEQALAQGLDDKDKIMLLRMIPKQLAKIGARYQMPVYQIHQLSGEANSKGSSARLSLTEMEGCRSLARSVDFALLINKPTSDRRAIVTCDKHRRFLAKQLERVIRINGAYMRVCLDDSFTIDGSSRAVVPRDLVHGVTKPTYKPDSPMLAEEVNG